MSIYHLYYLAAATADEVLFLVASVRNFVCNHVCLFVINISGKQLQLSL